MRPGIRSPARALPPLRYEQLGELSDRNGVVLRRPEIPLAGQPGFLPQPLAEHKIAVQRIEHVLPRPRRIGIADLRRATVERGAYQVGNQAILGPIASTDHIASPRRGERHAMLVVLIFRKE